VSGVSDLVVLNQLDDGVSRRIESEVAGVTAITLPPSGEMPDGIGGDVLLIPRRSDNWPELIAAGVDWIHIAGAGAEEIPFELLGDLTVTCSRGAYAVPMAEYAMAAIVAAEKGIPNVWVSKQPEGPWGDLGKLEDDAERWDAIRPWEAVPDRWGYVPMGTLVGRVLGVVGFGETGKEIARRALPFGMEVLGVRRTDAPSPIDGVEIVGLHEALARSDHVVITAPATPETEHLIDREAFSVIRPGAHLVNVARGSLVDQEALLAALESGRLGLATLDVSYPEPLPDGHELYRHPRVRLSPHVSWASPTRQRRVVDLFIEELARYAAGEPLRFVVDLEAGY
jgi:phosphoglycerate dehydrogenase-like enzyme